MSDSSIIGLTIVIGAWVCIGGILGMYVATEKRRGLVEGLMLGACFGLFGVLIEALLPSRD